MVSKTQAMTMRRLKNKDIPFVETTVAPKQKINSPYFM